MKKYQHRARKTDEFTLDTPPTIRAKKKYGQHFLTNAGLVSKIVAEANIAPGDKVLEIGPGQGALTKQLLEAGADLTVVEIDPDMREIIARDFPQVRIIDADASQIDFASVLDTSHTWKCVSNLPYNVGTKITQNLLLSSVAKSTENSVYFSDLILMLQKEVGERMVAEPDDRNRGSLSSFVQSCCASVEKCFLLPPGAFSPPPSVDSVVVHLCPLPSPIFAPVSVDTFETLNKALFTQPRKTIKNSVKKDLSPEAILYLQNNSSVSFSARPANLSNQDIVDLVKLFDKFLQSC